MAESRIAQVTAISPNNQDEIIRVKGFVDYDESLKTRAVNFKWEAAKGYYQNDVVVIDGIAYQCIIDHTSTTFEDDVFSKWNTVAEMGNAKNIKQAREQQVAVQTVQDIGDPSDYGGRKIIQVDGKPVQFCSLDGKSLKHSDQEQSFPISRLIDANETIESTHEAVEKIDTLYSIDEVDGEELLYSEIFSEEKFDSKIRDSGTLLIDDGKKIEFTPGVDKLDLSKLGLFIRNISSSNFEDPINEYIQIDAANTTTNTVSLDASLQNNYPKGSLLIKAYTIQTVVSTGATTIDIDTVVGLSVGARLLITDSNPTIVRTEEVVILSIDDVNNTITIQTAIQNDSGFAVSSKITELKYVLQSECTSGSTELKLESVGGLSTGDKLLIENFDSSANEFVIVDTVDSVNNIITIQTPLDHSYIKDARLIKSAYILDILDSSAEENIQLKNADELKFESVEGLNSGDVLLLTEFLGAEPYLGIRLYRDIKVKVDPTFEDDFTKDKIYESKLLEKKYLLSNIRKEGKPDDTSLNDWFYFDIHDENIDLLSSELDEFKKHIIGDETYHVIENEDNEIIGYDEEPQTGVVYAGTDSDIPSDAKEELREYLVSYDKTQTESSDRVDEKELDTEINLWIEKQIESNDSKVKYYFVPYIVVPFHHENSMTDTKLRKNTTGWNHRVFYLPESGKYSVSESSNVLVLKDETGTEIVSYQNEGDDVGYANEPKNDELMLDYMAVDFSDDAVWKTWEEGDYIGVDLKTGRIKLPDDSRVSVAEKLPSTIYAEFNHVEFLEEWINEKFIHDPEDPTGDKYDRNTLVIDKIVPSTENGTVSIKNATLIEDATVIKSKDLAIKDNEIVLNDGEEGDGVTLNTAGIRIDRGMRDDSLFSFTENGANPEYFGFSFDDASTYPFKFYQTGEVSATSVVTSGDVTAIDGTSSAKLTATGDVIATGKVDATGNVETDAEVIATDGTDSAKLTSSGDVVATGKVDATGNVETDAEVIATNGTNSAKLTSTGNVTATGNITAGGQIEATNVMLVKRDEHNYLEIKMNADNSVDFSIITPD